MSFVAKKVPLTWSFSVLHNLNLRHVALLICSPIYARAAGLRGAFPLHEHMLFAPWF